MSYTSSPISPVAPILPAIPRLGSYHLIEQTGENDRHNNNSNGKDSWLRSFGPAALQESQVQGYNQLHGSEIPRLSATTDTQILANEDGHPATPVPQNNVSAEYQEEQQWPLAPNVFSELATRPSTAPQKDANHTLIHDERPRFMARHTADGRPVSANFSRPHTVTSAQRSFTQPYGQHDTSGFASIHGSSLSNSSVVMLEPVGREETTSSSRFPIQSYRPSAKTLGSSSTTSIPQLNSNTNVSLLQTHTAIGPAPNSQPLPPSSSIMKTKNKLSLLNPVSLLLRRRSQTPVAAQSEDPLVSQTDSEQRPPLPNDFDPSIRGSIIHDFSTPRDLRIRPFSPNSHQSASIIEPEPVEHYRPERRHTPVFTEHFDDGSTDIQAAIHAEQLENRDFVARNTPMAEPFMATPLPPFGRPPSTLMPISLNAANHEEKEQAGDMIPLTPVVEEIPTVTSNRVSDSQKGLQRRISGSSHPRNRRSTASRISRRSIISNTNTGRDASFSLSRIPSYSNSQSSRFSFQLAGSGSFLQEQMLEERHKQKEAAKRFTEKQNLEEPEEAEEDDEYIDFDDDMGDEEEIPTVGDAWGYNDSGNAPGLGNMTLGDSILDDEDGPTVGEDWSISNSGNGIGISNMTLDNSHLNNGNEQTVAGVSLDGRADNVQHHPTAPAVQGLGILPVVEEDAGLTTLQDAKRSSKDIVSPQRNPLLFDFGTEDDDLYFDDGVIDEANYDDTEQFNESVLDDPSHPLYERKPKQALDLGHATASIRDDGYDADREAFQSNVTVMNFAAQNPFAMSQEQYHSILAEAARKAQQSGRFDRLDNAEMAKSPPREDVTREASSQPSLVQDDSISSPESQASPSSDVKPSQTSGKVSLESPDTKVVFDSSSGYDTLQSNYMPYASDLSDWDSAMEDDDEFIAAANADALANDDEGVYGQEFGFYSRPHSGEESFQDGGYFGSREWSEIQRKKSTREPNLTPITERSEYSVRSSFVNLPSLDRDRNQPSPGLAQLARMSPGAWEGDMSMEALMRLRKGAFGGSQASLGSFGSGRDGPTSPLASSPVNNLQEARSAARPGSTSKQSQMVLPTIITSGSSAEQSEEDVEDSDYTSTEEVDDEDEDCNEHPERSRYADVVRAAGDFSATLGVTSPPSTSRSGHSRSGSDTITYEQEQDEGESKPHWVVMRWRTGEDGVQQVIDRSRIENGRI